MAPAPDPPGPAVSETPLAGGAVTAVVRVGETVRRAQCANSDFVHRLLQRFEQVGWEGAPRYLGVDEKGREILSYVAGHVDWSGGVPMLHSEATLAQAARLTRAFHDLTAGSALAGGEEVVCHNDLSWRNAVCRSENEPRELFAFIDWDNAAPGRRIHDVAHVGWQFIGFGPLHPDVAAAARGLRVVADAYGLGSERGELVETILWWQDRCWRGIEARARAGEPGMIALRDRGGVSDVQASFDWTREHRAMFERALLE